MKKKILSVLLALGCAVSCAIGLVACSDGEDGTDGKDGVGIQSVEINTNGEIVITYTNGETENIGKISCDHKYSGWTKGVASDCYSMGYNYRVCSKCGYKDYSFLAPLGHKWDEGNVFLEATTESFGITVYTCKTCGFVETRIDGPHVLEDGYRYDSKYHYDYCIDCEAHLNQEKHQFNYNNCTTCGYEAVGTNGIEYELSSTTCTVKGIGTATATDIVIPCYYDNKKVTTVSGFAESRITSVTMHEGIDRIAYDAFEYCANLKSVTIPDSVTYIGGRAFGDCTSLKSVTIPDNVTEIGWQAFCGCTSLTSITLSDSVTKIENSAFWNCSKLTTVYYKGTPESWSKIMIGDENSKLTSSKIYYYSESSPKEKGNYWHYDKTGKIVVW